MISDLASNGESNNAAEIVRRFYKKWPGIKIDERGGQTNMTPPNRENLADPSQYQTAPRLEQKRSVQVASYHALQQWEGNVTYFDSEKMIVELVDITRGGARPTEQAEIPLSELSYEQLQILRLGSVFRWTIGYETLPSSQKRRVSQLVFRQLPQWTKADLNAANRGAEIRNANIRWE